jgi:hypothetical protein
MYLPYSLPLLIQRSTRPMNTLRGPMILQAHPHNTDSCYQVA